VNELNAYARGAWEALNYVIRFLEENEKDASLKNFGNLKEQIEAGVAIDFQLKLRLV